MRTLAYSPPRVYKTSRGVQYVNWVMHKCIMVKVGGEIHVKYVKSCWMFWKQREFWKQGEIQNFRESGGKCSKTGKIGGQIRNLWSMTKKKVVRNFGGWKWEICSGKGKMFEIFQKVPKFFENRGKSETEGKMHHGLRGMDAPEDELLISIKECIVFLYAASVSFHQHAGVLFCVWSFDVFIPTGCPLSWIKKDL